MRVSSINRFFNILFGALAMLVVALVCAYLAMRVTIHGREVEVPSLAGMTYTQAAQATRVRGLRMRVENRFYSPDVPAGQVLSQSPAPGSVVRREWAVRVTTSLGPQLATIPDLTGQTERPAIITVRQLGLLLGSEAHLYPTSDAESVVAQSPSPSAQGVDRPYVSILLAPLTPHPAPAAYVMPELTGLTLTAAAARLTAAGLHLVPQSEAPQDVPQPAAGAPAAGTPAAPPVVSLRTVTAQSPPAGYRVTPDDPIRLSLGY
ncbi:MAG: PASTA domain-containing protein [Acidobacteriota bacterium]|nr:PASTA domain-containing protein [Acidobacteriota bacterium]